MKTLLLLAGLLQGLSLIAQPGQYAMPLIQAGISIDLSGADYGLTDWANGMYVFAPNGYADVDSMPGFFILYKLGKREVQVDSSLAAVHEESLVRVLKQNPPLAGAPATAAILFKNYPARETLTEVLSAGRPARFYQLTIDHPAAYYLFVALAYRDPDTEMARIRRVLETTVFLTGDSLEQSLDPMTGAGFSLALAEFGYALWDTDLPEFDEDESIYFFVPTRYTNQPSVLFDTIPSGLIVKKTPKKILPEHFVLQESHENVLKEVRGILETESTELVRFQDRPALETSATGRENDQALRFYFLTLEQSDSWYNLVAFAKQDQEAEIGQLKRLIQTLTFH